MKAVADSSFLVALLYPLDTHHHEAMKILEEVEELLVHTDVLKESLTIITYRMSIEVAKRAFDVITTTEPFVIIDDGEYFDFWFHLRKKISYFDAMTIALSLQHGYELLTFDKQQKRVWKKLKQEG